MHIIGKINYEIYKCITDQITTDEVIITENQIEKRISLARFSACGGACKRHLPYRRSAILAERFMS